jgi:hypothetical protein
MKTEHVWRLCFGLFLLLFVSSGSAFAIGFSTGDILVALTNGTVQVRGADGTLKGTLSGPITGQAKGLAFDAEGNLLVSYWWNEAHTSGNTVGKFLRDGTFAGTFGSGYSCDPTGIAVDKNGNVYIGEASCSGEILMFNSAGNSVDIFPAFAEGGGPRWLDLAADGCTMYYTSDGKFVQRYNVCTETQLSNFNPLPLGSGDAAALGLRIMSTGGVIVADTYDVRRLDSSGNVVAVYDAIADQGFAAVFIESDGKSFWTASFDTSNVYKFDIATGAILMSFNANVPGARSKGVIVVPPHEEPPDTALGRMTGGGNFLATNGTVVHHGFQLRCNVRDPRQNLEVNWGKGENFHLLSVTSITCSDNPALDPENPEAPIDTLVLTGTGRYNKEDATISLIFTDDGEPGVDDGVQMVIKDAGGNVVLDVALTTLVHGNHQAHRATGTEF